MLNLLATLIWIVHAQGEDLPFWKAKEKVYERIQNGEVIVSVREEERKVKEGPKHRLLLNGGGIVAAPCDFVYRTALNFEEIAQITGYIHDPNYDEKTHTLAFTVSAFFHTSTMRSKIETRAEPPPAYIDSTVLNGPMPGFFYRLAFEPLKNGKCEVAIRGNYEYERFPIPRFFLEFGLETVFQAMAKRLRSHVEERWTTKPRM